jgi:dTDP-4-dehydrorhamnose reductase
VVGASGQVGRQLVLALGSENVIEAGRDVIDLSRLSRDCAAVQQILRERNIRSVYCVGGATDVERCESDWQWAMETNYQGPAVLASLCAQIPFVYFSTEYVFDGKAGPYTESAPVNPICVYGESKALGEAAILKAHPAPAIVRTTVVYGEDPGGKNFLYSLRRNLSAGKRMRVPVDQISTPTYNRDLARASIDLVDAGRSGIFHVCGPERLSRYDFAGRFAEMSGLDQGLIDGVATAELGQKARRPLNAGLLTRRFAMRDIESGIRDWLGFCGATLREGQN